MAPKQTPPPVTHRGNHLATLAAAATAAHAAIGQADTAAVAAAAGQLAAARATKGQRRQDRLAAIEERNKHAAGHPEPHPAG